ncbi:hypothetical protein BsWGS_28938 [Bradybaena similaris]
MADDKGSSKKTKKVGSCQSKSLSPLSVERMKSASFTGTSGNSSMTSLNSDGDGKTNYGSSCSSGDSGVEMGPATEILDQDTRLLSYTIGDITDCLYESLDDFCPEEKNSGKQKSDSIIKEPPPLRSRSVTADRKSPNHAAVLSIKTDKKGSILPPQSTSLDDDGPNSFSISLGDNSGLEGLNTMSLLNDVLRDCGNMNDFSTEDFDCKDVKKETTKFKKSADFETRMATVAATLDLTKQQQRSKRQIPRPPVSPPPEPNLSQVMSPKKVVSQSESAVKPGIIVGKTNVTMPLQQDAPVKNVQLTTAPCGVEDPGSFPENTDSLVNRTNSESKNKKGLTSFFRNMLRKGKGSTENLEAMNSESQSSSKLERKGSSVFGSVEETEEDPTSSCVDGSQMLRPGPLGKCVFTPPTSPLQHRFEIGGGRLSDSIVNGNDSSLKVEPDAHLSQQSIVSTDGIAASLSTATASPPAQRKISKGLASPKMMLKRATAKFSPPASRHSNKTQEKEQERIASLSLSSAKPNPAPKPVVSPPVKPATATDVATSATAGTAKEADTAGRDKESSPTPSVVRRRAASPKRAVPPVPPTRTSIGTVKASSTDGRSLDAAKELERRLSQTSTEQPEGAIVTKPDPAREPARRSMPVPPSPPSDKKEKSGAASPSISPIPVTENSFPSSPSSPAAAMFDFTNVDWSGGSSSTIDDELPKFSEKIELPTVATQSRKGFLGKLSGNRKMRTLQPAPVKRAKSITESSTLPRGDKKGKKINVADISGPVMVTDITNSRVLGNRRNTISLGSDPAFAMMSASTMNPVNTTSSASIDKSSFDEFDIPVLSPLGSLENLYESILPKPEGNLFHYYDPPTVPKVLCPNIPADGYLEPVPPLSSSAASSSSAPSLAPGLSAVTAASLQTAPSLSLTPTNATAVSVTKSPLKSKTSFTRFDRTVTTLPRCSKDAGSSYTAQISTSSSETSSAENSGSSLPDSALVLKSISDALTAAKIGSCSGGLPLGSSGIGPSFVEPEMTEQRRLLLAAQPIYEEIPNGGSDTKSGYEGNCVNSKPGKTKTKAPGLKIDVSSRKISSSENILAVQKALLQAVGSSGDKNKTGFTWLQQSHVVESGCSGSLLSTTAGSLTPKVATSPSHVASKHNQTPTLVPSSVSMTSSQIMSASIMTTSLTSSMLPPPPPPPDHLPAPHPSASRSASRETVSSESDAQSTCSTFSRPRPAPRQKPRRPYTGSADQYVSMNRPNTQVSLSEDRLRDVFTKLTNITFHALQDIYAQCERILSVDRLNIPNSKLLKWADFDMYGQPLHASGRCVVYNAKLRSNSSPCQIMILHSRPATEMCATCHPSLLRPSAVFADTIPFSYLTPDFIKTSQLLQNSVYDSSQAKCFIAVGAFDIVENLESHLALLRENLAQDLNSYLNVILTAALQLLSAMSHCLDQGFSVTETDYNDVFLITRSDLRGKVVAFLPHQRSLDVPQGEAMCNFLDRLLTDALPIDDDEDDIDDEADVDDEEGDRVISSPQKVVAKLRSLLESRRVECLGHVRTAVEYLLWGPAQSELPLSPVGSIPSGKSSISLKSGASREQELYVWLEKERVSTVGRLARSVPGLGMGLTLEEFYTLKFLLKSSAACLAESLRRLSR